MDQVCRHQWDQISAWLGAPPGTVTLRCMRCSAVVTVACEHVWRATYDLGSRVPRWICARCGIMR